MVQLERPGERSSPAEFGHGSYVVTLFSGGETLPASPLLWRESLPERLVLDHEQPLVTPAVEVFCLSDAIVSGSGWLRIGEHAVFNPSIYPRYCRVWYENNRVPDVGADLFRLTERRYPAGWHVCHFNCGVYGHWLSEVMPKLLALREFLRRWPQYRSMPVFMPTVFPPFVYAHTRALLPDVPIVTFNPRAEYIRSDQTFLPTLGIDHVYNGSLCGQLDDLRATPDSSLPRRIFVSRRSRSPFRELDNLRELEEIAVQEGLTAVYPEDYPFEGQIALFRGATMVVGEYGSALHNALFSPRGTLVFALNWINACQSRIARLRGHRIGYVLPSSGAEVVYSFGAPFRHYTVDPAVFRDRLHEAVALPAARA